MGFWRLIRPKPPWSPVHLICRNTVFCVFALACFVCLDIFATLHASSLTSPKILRDEAALWEYLRPAQRSCEVFRTVGRPPVRAYRMLLPSESETMTVSSEYRGFFFPFLAFDFISRRIICPDSEVHSANENLYSLPAIPRNAGIRAALPTDEQQMTVVVPLTVKTSDLGAYSSIYTGGYPGSTTIKMPCGSTSSSHLADGSVCLEFCRPAKISLFSGA